MCLETGSYLLNYAACAQCGGKGLAIKNRVVTEDEDELITYQRVYIYNINNNNNNNEELE